MKDKEFEAWKLTRAKGKFNFFFVYGVLKEALPMAILLAFFNYPFKDDFTSEAAIIYSFIIFFMGLVLGAITWYMRESKYKKEFERREKMHFLKMHDIVNQARNELSKPIMDASKHMFDEKKT